MKFKEGDKLICIDESNNDPSSYAVKVGKVYTFVKYAKPSKQGEHVELKENAEYGYTPYAWRFKLATSEIIKERLGIK